MDTDLRKKTYNEAPLGIVKLYSDPEAGGKMYEVFQKYNLLEEHYNVYANIIGDVILGISPMDGLATILVKELHIGAEVAVKIAEEVKSFLEPMIAVANQDMSVPETTESVDVDAFNALLDELEAEGESVSAQLIHETKNTIPLDELPVAGLPVAPTPATPAATSTAVPETPLPAPTAPTPEPMPAPTAAPLAAASESQVQPLRTMEGDINQIHGYGAFQKAQEQESDVVQGLPQDSVLSNRPKLSDTPTYTPPPQSPAQ